MMLDFFEREPWRSILVVFILALAFGSLLWSIVKNPWRNPEPIQHEIDSRVQPSSPFYGKSQHPAEPGDRRMPIAIADRIML
jgi:hypothetical protein